MQVVLGVDAGGTKTDLMVADVSGKVLSSARTGPSNFVSEGVKRASENLLEGIRELIDGSEVLGEDTVFSSSCFGIAGYNSPNDLENIERILFGTAISDYLVRQKTLILNDTRIGLAAGTDKENAVIVICGTGSNCYGIDEEGREAKANGWDWILGDQGSGYQMGLKALQAIMKDYDGRGEKTSLRGCILEKLDVDIYGLIDWTYREDFSKSRIAELAKQVCDEAGKGDEVSRRILEEEAGEVLSNINTVVEKLDLGKKDFDVVFLGGNFKCIDGFKSIINRELTSRYDKINLVDLDKKPVQGAIKLAIKELK